MFFKELPQVGSRKLRKSRQLKPPVLPSKNKLVEVCKKENTLDEFYIL